MMTRIARSTPRQAALVAAVASCASAGLAASTRDGTVRLAGGPAAIRAAEP
jgi:hypothetical protein